MTIRAIKTSLKSILTGSFFVLGLFFIISASAQTMWITDTFESYNLGNLAGQGNWLSGSAAQTQVTDELAKGGTKSIETGGSGVTSESYQNKDPVATGFVDFWFYPDGTVGGDTASFGFYINQNANVQFGFNTSESYCNQNQYYKFSGTGEGFIDAACNMDTWNYLAVEWYVDGTFFWKWKINDSEWSAWEDTKYQAIKTVNKFRLVGDELFYDDIGIELILGEYERDIIVSPIYPPDGEITEEDYNFIATGNWEVPEDSLICYRKLSIYFEDIETGEINSFTKDIEGNPNTSSSYSISVTNLGDKNYYVWYRSSGYLYCIFLMGNIVYSTHEVENTIVRVGSYPELPVELEAQLFYPESPFENCSGYELLERLVCEIKNFGYSLIYPKPENTVLLKRNFEQIKKKAPLNYVSLIKNEFTTMKEQMGTEKISFSIFGNEAEVDFKIFEQEHEFKGQNFTLGNLILYSSSFILILLFAFYLINVIRRIF